MKAALHKFGAVCLALVVLFSTLSFTVDMHYCGRTLVDFSLDQADNCLMKSLMPEDSSACESMKKMRCCTDVEITFEGQDELKMNFDQLTLNQQVFIVAYAYTFIDLLQPAEENRIPFDGYPPPILVQDIQVLYETFLI
ncbi:HYC_CC_PP family protein [Lentiprolixibacter aurantiacus]|uniref:HYC_CC_PP family protein n=1 Tax=Lentiprolixibacter aurantiacus TaxID=2993939 RepID=UPI003F72F326